jgi:hypothetical protein
MTLLIPTSPTAELVALGWIKDVVTAYDIATGTTLQGPDPETQVLSWGATGFVQCAVVGGSVNGTVPIRQPVMSVDCWAANVNGSRPPWGRANSIAELSVRAARSFNWGDTQRLVTLPSTFGAVLVRDGSVLTEPERRLADEAGYAHYGFELQVSWLPL